MEDVANIITGKLKVVLTDGLALCNAEYILARYKTTHAWLTANKLYVGGTSDSRKLTHTGLNKKRLCLPDEASDLFHRFLARDFWRGVPNYFCELLAGVVIFRLFADFDLEQLELLYQDELKEICVCVAKAAARFFTETDCWMVAWYSEGTKMSKTVQHTIDKMKSAAADKNKKIKRGGKAVAAAPAQASASNVDNDDDNDDDDDDGDKDGTKDLADHVAKVLYNKYGLHLVWPEVPSTKLMAILVREMALAILRCRFPRVRPPTHNDWMDRYDKAVFSEKSDRGGGLRLPFSQKMAKCGACGGTDKKLINNCTYCDSETGLIAEGRPYTPLWVFDRRGDFDEARTTFMRSDHEAAIRHCHLRLPARTPVPPDFKPPYNAPVPPEMWDLLHGSAVVSASSSSSLTKTTTSSRTKLCVRSQDAWLECAARYRHNIESLAKFNKRKWVQKDSPILQLVQSDIRVYNPSYSEIELVNMFSHKSDKADTSFHICIVRGIGSNYCLNKGANHKGNSVIFRINQQGELSQQCLSPKEEKRPIGGCKCSEYTSCLKQLSSLTLESLDLMYRKPKKAQLASGVRTLTQSLELRKFEQAQLEASRQYASLNANFKAAGLLCAPRPRVSSSSSSSSAVGHHRRDLGNHSNNNEEDKDDQNDNDNDNDDGSSSEAKTQHHRTTVVAVPAATPSSIASRLVQSIDGRGNSLVSAESIADQAKRARAEGIAARLNAAKYRPGSELAQREQEIITLAACVYDTVVTRTDNGDMEKPACMTLTDDDLNGTAASNSTSGPGRLRTQAEIHGDIRKRAREEEEAKHAELKASGMVLSTIMVPQRPRKEDVLRGIRPNTRGVQYVTVPLPAGSVQTVELALQNRASFNAGATPAPKKRRVMTKAGPAATAAAASTSR